jgi:ribonucleoside-diphosphate reductase beta chain
MEIEVEDDLLPALATGDAHCQGDGRRTVLHRTTGARLLAGKPGSLRGLPVNRSDLFTFPRGIRRIPPAPSMPQREGFLLFGTSMSNANKPHLLDPGFDLTLRPMRYPQFYEMYKDAIKNTWTVEEIDFGIDLNDLTQKLSAADRHLIERLVAFFATGDSIVSNNLVLNLYQHINAPEARMYLSRQLYEEALHVQFYLTLLDSYIPDPARRGEAFDAIENIPSIKAKAAFCFKWMDSVQALQRLETRDQRRAFLLNLICFACCIEGLFFFAAFAYVWFLRSRGLLPGLAAGTNWVFRDESGHMAFALEVIHTVRSEDPALFDAGMESNVRAMLREAIEVEAGFADDVLSGGVNGLSAREMRQYLEYVADLRLSALGLAPEFGAKNPFPFMDLQDVQELTNFFERRVSAYQVGISGAVGFDDAF